MNREEAFQFVKKYVKNENSIKHMLAVEAVMCSLAKVFNENEEKWALAGLLHDVDMEMVDYRNNPEKHGTTGVEMLKEVDKEILGAILAHNPATGKKRETLMEKAIFAVDPLTGLIVASVLVTPEKKISKITTQSIMNRFKEKSFAKGADRETILACEELGIGLEEFISISLEAMKKIEEDLGL